MRLGAAAAFHEQARQADGGVQLPPSLALSTRNFRGIATTLRYVRSIPRTIRWGRPTRALRGD